ncbi:MAG: InlB B-repeat-containing protein [Prevotella sp.]|nr:InlB B-repeat-containing protein [Prevotella sp.]
MRQKTNRLFSRAAVMLLMMLLMMLLTTATAWAETENVSYIDENGQTQTVTATVLTGDEPVSNGAILLKDGWYVVKNTKDGVDVSYTNPIIDAGWPQGPINIILCDDAEMSVAVSGNDGIELNYGFPLTIYGQSAGTGRLTVSSDSKDAIEARGGVTINGGIVSATATNNYKIAIGANGQAITINGGQVTATGTYGIETDGTITFGLRKATDFISFSNVSHHNVIDINNHVKIVDGQALTDGTNIYNNQTPAATLEALENVTLRPAIYTVTFDSNGGSAVDAQTVFHGEKASEPADPTREGYTFGGWKNGDADYDFSAAVTSNLNLTAEWTPITYTVQFDNNGGSGTMDAVVATYDQWTGIPACTFTAPTGYALKEWNRQADGSGTAYEAENGDFRNLANEQGAVVTLYAQWGKDLGTCTADVPNPIYHSGYPHSYFYDGSWNDNHGGITVYDGGTLLTYGTDYQYKTMESLDGGSCENLDEHCRVYLQGLGAYAGTLYKDVVIVPATVSDAKWGDLTWNLDSDGKFTITGKGAMDAADNYYSYPWYNYGSYFTTITIGENITTVAAAAFGGDSNTNNYSSVTSVSLPTTLTEIGENAFAYCTGVTFNADNLIAQGVTIGENAFNQVGCIVGTLSNNADNTTMLSLMGSARTANVTLSGRTLTKDGKWNTLCLPFRLDADQIAASPLAGATIKTLDIDDYYDSEGNRYPYYNASYKQTGLDGTTLYLYFKDATTIEAGTPYIVKWTSGDAISSPMFTGVSVHLDDPTPITSSDSKVTFVGQYSPFEIDNSNINSVIMLSTNNTLGYSKNPRTLRSFRAHFEVPTNGSEPAARSFVINFDDESTGISLTPAPSPRGEGSEYYTLDGRKLDGKPTKKGMYIVNGKKVVVK